MTTPLHPKNPQGKMTLGQLCRLLGSLRDKPWGSWGVVNALLCLASLGPVGATAAEIATLRGNDIWTVRRGLETLLREGYVRRNLVPSAEKWGGTPYRYWLTEAGWAVFLDALPKD